MKQQKSKQAISRMMRLYAVTDRAWEGKKNICEQVCDAIKGGVTCIQIREKELSDKDFLFEAIEMKAICQTAGVPFIVNDNVDIAIKSEADGIHVGQSDMETGNVREIVGSDMIIGVSAQTVEQALKAQAAGADYLGVGAVFSTSTKKDADDVSYETLKAICEAVDIPVVAIGGITKENMMQLSGSGVDGVALVSAIFAAEDIENECKELLAISEKMVACDNDLQRGSTKNKTMKTALTIAGSDSGGGAGIQADIKTMTMNNVFATSAITALTAQNTLGVSAISEVSPEFLKSELTAVFDDIFPDAVKIGMVSSSQLISVIADTLKEYKATNIVVDPVMVATSGSKLMKTEALETLIEELIPIATLVTPNIPEAEILSGMTIENKGDMVKAAKIINKECGCAVLLKGGHDINDANDLLVTDNEEMWFEGKRINNPNTHGTGCTLSSAIASNLAKGYDLKTSVKRAKDYISGALSAMLDLGKGSGPMNHAFDISGEFAQEND